MHSALLTLLVQLGVILALARILGAVFVRLGQPQVVGEMVAGILLGPSVLGAALPGAMARLFPERSMDNLNLISQVGLVLFMFLVGLEVDPAHFRGKGRTAVAISAGSIVAPFVLGSGLAVLMYARVSSPSVYFPNFVMFIGAAMSVTAFPVLARILTEQNLVKTRLGSMALLAGAANDVMAWCVLAVITTIAHAGSPVAALGTAGLALVYVAFMLTGGRLLLNRVAQYSINRGELTHNVLAVVLLLILASAWVSERIGIHALFGAFLIGTIMPRDARLVRQLSDRLEHVTVVFILPAFFAYAGLRTQLGLVAKPHLWPWAVVILVVACAGKYGGSLVAARATGMSWRESHGLGVLMNTRGLMELVILTIGLELAIITREVFAMMVIMAIVTTLMTTPILARIFPAAQRRRELVAAEAAAETFPIVVPVSLPRSGGPLLRLAAAITDKDKDKRKIHPLFLARARDTEAGAAQDLVEERARETLAPALEEAARLGIQVSPISLVSRDIAQDICEVAATKEARLILMGWHKPVLGGAVLGGTVRDVMTEARTHVGVFIDRGMRKLARVFVPFLGEPSDQAALQIAQRLSEGHGTEVVILHVVSPERAAAGAHAEKLGAGEKVETVFGQEERPLVTMKVVASQDPVRAVVDESKAGYDLAIVGVSQKWQLEPELFGMRQERLVQECPASLLIVHSPGG